MSVTNNLWLLRWQKLLHFSLFHAAVGTYPFVSPRNELSVNRSLWVYRASATDASRLRDLKTGRDYPLKEGFVYFIPCHHEVAQDLTATTEFVSFQFNLDFSNGVDCFGDYGACEALKLPAWVAEARSLMTDGNAFSASCRLHRLLFQLSAALLEERPGWAGVTLPENTQAYEPALRRLETACSARTTVAELARLCGMRQDVFSRSFTRDMRITPKAWITRRLIRNAMALLLQKNAGVKAVAAALAFSSEYFFYRFFKKHTGLTPGQFRAQNGVGGTVGE